MKKILCLLMCLCILTMCSCGSVRDEKASIKSTPVPAGALSNYNLKIHLNTNYYDDVGRLIEVTDKPKYNMGKMGNYTFKKNGNYTIITALTDESTIDYTEHIMFCLVALPNKQLNDDTEVIIFDKQFKYEELKNFIVYKNDNVVVIDAFEELTNINFEEYVSILCENSKKNAAKVNQDNSMINADEPQVGVMGVNNYDYSYLNSIHKYLQHNFDNLIVNADDTSLEEPIIQNIRLDPRNEKSRASFQGAFFTRKSNKYEQIKSIIDNMEPAKTPEQIPDKSIFVLIKNNDKYEGYHVYDNDLIVDYGRTTDDKTCYYSKGSYNKLTKIYEKQMEKK